MKIVLDTNRYSDLARADPHVVSTVYAADLVHLPLVVLPNHNIWIAAQCLQHDLVLYARDDHFQHVPDLRRL